MKVSFFTARRRQDNHRRRVSRLSLEQLELRYVLDGASLVADVFDVHQNSPAGTLDVLANDVFPDDYAGARRITSISFGSEGGSIEIAGDGQSLRYAPPADYFGAEVFTYVVDDQYTAQVQVNVEAPLSFDQYVITPDGLQRTLNVMANDPFWADYDGPRLITSVSTASAGGEVAIASDGRRVLYTPPEGVAGYDQFIYIVDGIYPARVTVEIPETLKPDLVELVQHTTGTFQVVANDPFWAGYAGERRITHVLDVDEGATVVISPDGKSITYTPAPGAQYADSIRYVVDSVYETTVNLRIHRPVQNDWFETDENSTSQSFNVIANDTYRDLNNTVRDVVDRVTSVTQPESGGTVTISADGLSVVYTPPAGFTGVDKFKYVADGVHEAEVQVNVTRPVRDDQFYSHVFQDTPHAVLDVLSNDFLGNGYAGPKVITAVGPTANGGIVSIAADGKRLVYTPAAGYVGQDTFTYTVDGQLEAAVIVSVQALAQGDHYFFEADPSHGPYTLNVLSNDYFSRGYDGPGVITSVSPVSGSGSVIIVGGSALRFTPGATAATFTYTVDNKYEATVSFAIRNRLAGDAAVVDQNSGRRTIDVLANDFKPLYNVPAYVGPRIITAVSASQYGGTVVLSPDGKSVEYQPPADFYGDDSFTYTVDGIMQTTVQVHVIRRVRDDEFRVEADADSQRLPVLVNDLFGANYLGGQLITDVSATTAGGTVTIGADGKSIEYVPASGFAGKDTFVYTVDGRLKAEVTVLVGTNHADQFPTFGSGDEYAQFLLDDALVRYEYLFGQQTWGYPFLGPIELDATASNGRGHSETNVQVAGVDEGDIIEFDDDYVYLLTDHGLVIVDAWPAESINVASRFNLEGRPIAEFLNGDRLTIISQVGGYWLPWDYANSSLADGRASDAFGWPWLPYIPPTTIVTVLDVSDRTDPQVVQTTSMQGRYVDSRAVGDHVYVLVSNDNAVAPPPQIIPLSDDGDPATVDPARYETREEYVARVTANQGELIEAALPNYTSYGPDGEVVRTGLLNDPADIFRPLVDDARNLISVVSFDIASDEPGLADTSAVYTTGASVIYASLDNFYVFDRDYSREDGPQTRIVKFDWDPTTGGVEFAAAGLVAGSIINQFSIDEHDGYVRIATTISNSGAGNWSGRSENTLFVLQDDGGVLEPVGSLQNLALNETMRSIRFMGDRALLTTARTIDPLFGLDLSDPSNPRAVGYLTLPGFSTYMQFIDDAHLLTVGENTPVGGGGPTQVALYDVSDLSQPRRIDEYTFERFSTSEAQVDHHAFGYFAVHGLLALPTSRTYIVRVDQDGDGYRETRQTVREDQLAVLSIDVDAGSSAISLAGEIEHGTAVRRSGYIGDYLYSIAGDSVKVVHVDDPATIVGEVDVTDPNPPGIIVLPGPILVAPFTGSVGAQSPESEYPAIAPDSLTSAARKAQEHLAEFLGKAIGASVVVTAESTGDGTDAGWRIVLRVGDDQYLYYVRGEDLVVLANRAFDFPDQGGAEAWHAIAAAVSTPGDHNYDGTADGEDLRLWQAGFGKDGAGDADEDGDTDGADFLAWQRNASAPAVQTVAPSADADFNDDGYADGADFLAWQRGFGSSTSSASDQAGDADGDADVDAEDLRAWAAAMAAHSPAADTAGSSASQGANAPMSEASIDEALAQLLVATDDDSTEATRPSTRPLVRSLLYRRSPL